MSSILTLWKRHRLIWRIMMIFWMTTILTIVANIVITREIADKEHQRRIFEEQMRSFAIDAIANYLDQGEPGLANWYSSVEQKDGLRFVLQDEEGLALAHKKRRLKKPRYWRAHLFRNLSIIGPDKKLYTLTLLRSPAARTYWQSPERLHWLRLSVSFVIIFLGSAWLARSLARPVKALHQASEKIAKGQFGTRLPDWLNRRQDELGQLAHTFNQMAAHIESLLAKQEQLFRDISHEIRTPLTRQKLAIELARDSENPSGYLDKLEQQNQNIEQLIEQLLNLSKLNQIEEISLSPVDLVPLLQTLKENAALEQQQKQLDVRLPSLKSCWVQGNPELISRACENILLNAIKYAPPASIIRMGLSETEGWRIVSISDQGPGMEEAELKKATEPFYRSDQSRSSDSGGFGLGLAIVDRIMIQHKGKLVLKQAQGSRDADDSNGLIVQLYFPMPESSD